MGVCDVCGKFTDLPYTCSYCGLTLCGEHRLPEKHNCLSLPDRSWNNYRRRSAGDVSKKSVSLKKTPSKITEKIKSERRAFTVRNWVQKCWSKLRGRGVFSIMRNAVNILFLFMISLPVLDSIQLMWVFPVAFSKTVLPKWWELFPSEFPAPSFNLFYAYIIMVALFCITTILFLSKLKYKSHDHRRVRLRHYFFVMAVGAIFLFFFSEARFFWLECFIGWIYGLVGRLSQ